MVFPKERFMSVPATQSIAQFKFEGLMIERIIIHRIFPRTSDKQLVIPRTSNKLIKLEQDASDALQMRVTKALGNKSHGVEMSINEVNSGSFFQTAATMLHSDDSGFIALSKNLANGFNKALSGTTAPGGLLAIIAGRVGNDATPFVATIKAEPQDGFKANEQDDYVGMEYISELLLTDAQRFYKIGLLTEMISKPPGLDGYEAVNYRAFLFDHLMTATETRPAATYFYSNFLGMDIQKSSKKLTQDFFEYTRAFIDTLTVSDEEKFEHHEALRAELRSQEAIISTAEFGKKHFKDSDRNSYNSFMQSKGFPQNAVSKDTDYIHAKLKRRRKYLFNNDIWISTPPENIGKFLHIEPADEQGITIVKIKGRFQGQQ